jgi:hypothetical protein
MTAVALLVVYVALDVLVTWFAGYIAAMEDVVGGTRHRFENWAYRDADLVRYGGGDDPRDDPSDLFWDRCQLWGLTRQPPPEKSRWTYRGKAGLSPDGEGRKVPTRLLSPGRVRYAVPALDGKPLGRADRLATILRGKAADLWGCPKCSGMWGGAIVMAVAYRYGTWPLGWVLAGVVHFAAWGLARRIGWSKD